MEWLLVKSILRMFLSEQAVDHIRNRIIVPLALLLLLLIVPLGIITVGCESGLKNPNLNSFFCGKQELVK